MLAIYSGFIPYNPFITIAQLLKQPWKKIGKEQG